MIEEFKDIDGFDGYQISNFGRVYSVKYKRFLKPGLLHKNRGYIRVVLSKNKKPHFALVHRLVATAFCPNPKGYNVIHHLDNNPSNNIYTNLKWCTQAYNVQQAYDDGLNSRKRSH